MSERYLIVGLGNPGKEYEKTRHNMGYFVVDELARRAGLSFGRTERKARIADGLIAGKRILLAKPQTYMNLCGKSVAGLARFFKLQPEEILVAHDELDLPPGEAKLKLGGSHAGHNGLRDIHAQLGSDRYWRLRLGVGHPGVKAEVVHWVLKKPSLDHRIAIDQTIDRAMKALPHLLTGSMDKATMQIHTSKPPRPKLPKPAPWPEPVKSDAEVPEF